MEPREASPAEEADGGHRTALPDFASRRSRRLLTWILFSFHLVGVLSSVHAVMTARTAQGPIAWAVSLNTLPYVSVPAYWVLGRRKFSGYVESWRDRQEEVQHLVDKVRAEIAPYQVESAERIPNYEGLKALARTPLFSGHEIDLLVDGEETFDSILNGIDRAESYVLVQFYILRDDGLGRRLKEKLIEKAQQGLQVLILYDEIGSKDLPKSYSRDLEAAGASISAFNTTQGRRNRFQLNFRNHRKIVVVDGREAWIGGHNVGDEYLGLDPKVGPWRDTHVRIVDRPPSRRRALSSSTGTGRPGTGPSSTGRSPSQRPGISKRSCWRPGRRTRSRPPSSFFVHALNSARDRIWIATPYFVPDEAVTRALELAALRGVDVRILIPENPDNFLVGLSAWWFIEELERVNLHFYRYQPGFMHQKVILVDDSFAGVGTHNFDKPLLPPQLRGHGPGTRHRLRRPGRAHAPRRLERSEPVDRTELKEQPFLKRPGGQSGAADGAGPVEAGCTGKTATGCSRRVLPDGNLRDGFTYRKMSRYERSTLCRVCQ